MVKLFILGVVLEAALFVPFLWRARKWIVVFSITVTTFASGILVSTDHNLLSVLVLIIGIYRALSLVRITEGRLNDKYMHRAVNRASLYLIPATLILVGTWRLLNHFNFELSLTRFTGVVVVLQVVFAVIILKSTSRNISKTTYVPSDQHYSDHELPTVTVAIPARNETDDLSACLEAVIASDYPKLEILVLDDCSQDKTPAVIKSFAQDGVRFLHGREPKTNWLAKNQAYDHLTDNATGEYVVFCGVDTRVKSSTIRSLVTFALSRNKQMVGVMPAQQQFTSFNTILKPMRQWWELALPRRLFNRPAVLSSFWMIKRQSLLSAGGFDAVSNAVLPEAFFAEKMVKSDGYSFVRSSDELYVSSVKQLDDQIDRAIRLRYPEVHRRIELVLGLSLAELVFLFGPIISIIISMVTGSIFIFLVGALALRLLLHTHWLIINATSTNNQKIHLYSFPMMVLGEIAILNLSMWRYEFGTVDWKGRNICIPVVRAEPHKFRA